MRTTRGSMRRMAVVGRLLRKRWAGTAANHLQSPLPGPVPRPYITRLLATAARPYVTRLLATAARPYVTRLLATVTRPYVARLLSTAASHHAEGASPILGYEDVPELKRLVTTLASREVHPVLGSLMSPLPPHHALTHAHTARMRRYNVSLTWSFQARQR